MRNLILVALASFALGHYWKTVIKFVTSKFKK